jgi:CheY-like chemotaxis protein
MSQNTPALTAKLRTSSKGCRAIQAGESTAGLKILQSDGPIDLLITDVGLPKMNDRQMADAPYVSRPGLTVLFITASPQAQKVEPASAEEIHMSEFLDDSKSVLSPKVRSAIRVINLPNASNRRQLFETTNQGLSSMDWEFYPAVLGSEWTVEYDRTNGLIA